MEDQVALGSWTKEGQLYNQLRHYGESLCTYHDNFELDARKSDDSFLTRKAFQQYLKRAPLLKPNASQWYMLKDTTPIVSRIRQRGKTS